MNIAKYQKQIQEQIIAPMTEFMAETIDEDGSCDYTQEDIDACERLLNNYVASLAALTQPTDQAIMQQVKSVVLALNKLNEETDYALIETEEREAIWEVIQGSAIACGLKNPSDDITEDWRDW